MFLSACRSDDVSGPTRFPDEEPADVYIPPHGRYCDLPGSVQQTNAGVVVIAGGSPAHEPTWLHLPEGFCAHYYGAVGNARQLRFAPGGELFVASPITATTGGRGDLGLQAIIVLPDDNHDGLADAPVTFADGLPSTQGLLFANDHFYYQDGGQIVRVPYASGDRAPSAASELVAQVSGFQSTIHWPKTLDQAVDGTLYVSNGDDENSNCQPGRPFRGGILKLDGTPGGTPVAKGFRNPIAVRCQRSGKGNCFAVELSRDYSTIDGGREKLVPIRDGDDWGYPCCATKGVAYSEFKPAPDCSTVTPEDVSFLIGDTPFGVDFAPDTWPAPYSGSAIVPLHGIVGSWDGARVLAIEMDPVSGLPKPGGTDIKTGKSTGAASDFAVGWDNSARAHGRPSSVAFSADGRLFIGNDNDGVILWIAPLDLMR